MKTKFPSSKFAQNFLASFLKLNFLCGSFWLSLKLKTNCCVCFFFFFRGREKDRLAVVNKKKKIFNPFKTKFYNLSAEPTGKQYSSISNFSVGEGKRIRSGGQKEVLKMR